MSPKKALARADLEEIFAALLKAYGPQHWWPADSAFEIIVGAILIQRTAWRNAELALLALSGAGYFDAGVLATASEDKLRDLIRPAGFYRQKSRRLVAVSRWVVARGGLERIAELDHATLRQQLIALPGIGEETADAICLYAFGRPNFVIDAYTRRLFSRLELIDGQESYAGLRAAFESTLAADSPLYNEYHALIVEHGKQRCRTRPRCEDCVLLRRCPSGGVIEAVSH